jgi:phytoene desaturase
MLLAHAGADVHVYESLPVIGGRSRRMQVGEFAFDTGPTFFMMPYVLEEIFTATGRRLEDYCDLHRLDPMYRLLMGRKDQDPLQLDTTQDVDAMAARLAAINPKDGPAFLRFMRDTRRKLELMEPILRRPIRGLSDLLSMDILKAGPVIKPWKSLHGLLSTYFEDEQIRLALCFQSKYLGMSPFECPSLFSILPFIEYEYGVWHPRGGCNALMQGMADACTEMGVTISTSSRVDEITFDGRRARGVMVDGQEHRHDQVVINADAGWAIANLIPESLRRRWTNKKLDSRRYSCSTYMLYLGLDGEVELPHHTIYTSRTYVENLEDIANRGRLSEDPSIYVCNPSRLDPTLAPSGSTALYVLVPTPNTRADIDWKRSRGLLRERTIRQLEQVLGIEKVEARILAEKSVTPDDWKSEGIAHGATFNMAHNIGQMLHRRPQHRLEDVDGVWMVGGGTHPGSGLPVIFLASEITTRLLCKEVGLDDPMGRNALPNRRPVTAGAPSWSEPKPEETTIGSR